MGLYDTVLVPCPRCTHLAHMQSKAGECGLAYWEPRDAPLMVLADIEGKPEVCEKCGEVFHVKLVATAAVVKGAP